MMATRGNQQPGQRRLSGQRRTGASSSSRVRSSRVSTGRSSSDRPRGTRASARSSAPRSRQSAASRRAPIQPGSLRRKSRRKQGPTRVALGHPARRLQAIMVVLAIAVSVCAGRLVQLQAFDTEAYAASASKQVTRTQTLMPERGQISDRNGQVLAASEPAVAITADPTHTAENAEEIAQIIGRVLGTDPEQYLEPLTRPDTRFAYVARKVPAADYTDIARALAEENIYGIFRESDSIRTYPAGQTGANIIGFVNGEGKGGGGLEYSLNGELTGQPGKEIYEASPQGNRIPLGTNMLQPAQDGIDYQLTIDSELQWTTQQRLQQAVDDSGSQTGTAIVLNIKTGEILAMATYPTFDPSRPGDADADARGNHAVTQVYEPGSTQKLITMAALADQGLLQDQTHVVVPPLLKSGDSNIRDVWGHGEVNMTARGILAMSSNIGTAMLGRQSDPETMQRYLEAFGYGKPTGVGLPGEASGSIPTTESPSYVWDRAFFGQSMSVTAIQQAAAIGTIYNGGQYMPPTIIKSAIGPDGKEIELPVREPRQVISEDAAREVTFMSEAVLTHDGEPTDQTLDGFRAGGKSGTSQRYDPDCGCYNGYTSSWVGVAPLEDPTILTYIVLDQPEGQNSGTVIAAPAWKDIMQYALPRYGVPLSTTAPANRKLYW
ncbi:cell division protein FtsI [Parenemella sanctibonifatiensis]|uniref:Cell division protein FtsI n=1 Tax=Parenemella sanctibonifatiensis TaxID=2016505 RepID=A0A255EE38_9ACTN|nr:cell division protein FtsI [Parenemella sanctibonifatiensis]